MYKTAVRRSLILFLFGPISILGAQEPPTIPSSLSYDDALRMAVELDPLLQVNAAMQEAAKGQVEQADVRPNPTIEAEVENILGTGSFSGADATEITLGVAQVIETANKRSKRTALARAERGLVDWEREMRMAVLEASVREAFVAVVLARDVIELREDQLDLAERSQAETSRLVEAARSPQLEQTRADLAVRQQSFALQQAEQELRAARSALAVLLGVTPAPAFEVVGSLSLEDNLPQLSALVALLPETAAVARYGAVLETREAALELEQARATPDFEVFAGARYYNEEGGDGALVAGVSIPWPIFDKNQGNIRTARARLRAVEHEREAARRGRLTRLAAAYAEARSAAESARAIQQDLLPAAEEALATAEAGYERGQFTQLAVLESRRALFDLRDDYLGALGRYARAEAAIESLTRPASLNQ